MSLIQYNFSWMSFNMFLAVLPIMLGWVFFKINNKILKVIFGISWLIFLPNTVYIFSDLVNFIKQWSQVGLPEKLVFIFQYGVYLPIGLITFILSMYPIEKILATRYLIILNFIIGFGITLGRVERINSWEVLTAPMKVIKACFDIILSPELLLLTILFGLFSNFLYFLFRKSVIRYLKIYLNQIAA